jgi:hypothetical protein
MAENAKSPFNGNLASSDGNPLDTAEVLQKGINGLSLHDFMQLTGMVNKSSGAADDVSSTPASSTAKSGTAAPKKQYGPADPDGSGYAPVITVT